MATYTTYLNLEKPTTSETFNLLKMNQNWDKIDAGVSALNSNMSTEVITLSSITISTGTAELDFAGYKILGLYNMRIVVRDVTLANDIVLGQIDDNRLRPKTNVYLKVYDHNNGKPINGSLYLNTNGTLTYYGDQLTNKTIMICDFVVVNG